MSNTKTRGFTISFVDIIMLVCTGGLWIIWMVIRSDMRKMK